MGRTQGVQVLLQGQGSFHRLLVLPHSSQRPQPILEEFVASVTVLQLVAGHLGLVLSQFSEVALPSRLALLFKQCLM